MKRGFNTYLYLVFGAAVACLVAAYVMHARSSTNFEYLTSVFINLGAAFLTVWLTAYAMNWLESEKAFEQFFGEGALNPKATGRILLQSDRIDELLKDLLKDEPTNAPFEEMLHSPYFERGNGDQTSKAPNRLYKARNWVNASDAAGAKEIREKFIRDELPPPELDIMPRKASRTSTAAPYEISMGLGFSVRTCELIERLGQGLVWIDKTTSLGDAIVLDRELFSKGSEFEDPQSGDTVTLWPKGWKEALWSKGEGAYTDYSIILRHVREENGQKSIEFVLAGFTEDGTAAAGQFLAQNWRDLNQNYVQPYPDEPGQFFLLFIVPGERGKREWRESEQIDTITPDRLNKLRHKRAMTAGRYGSN